jgi:hypothetical protein
MTRHDDRDWRARQRKAAETWEKHRDVLEDIFGGRMRSNEEEGDGAPRCVLCKVLDTRGGIDVTFDTPTGLVSAAMRSQDVDERSFGTFTLRDGDVGCWKDPDTGQPVAGPDTSKPDLELSKRYAAWEWEDPWGAARQKHVAPNRVVQMYTRKRDGKLLDIGWIDTVELLEHARGLIQPARDEAMRIGREEFGPEWDDPRARLGLLRSRKPRWGRDPVAFLPVLKPNDAKWFLAIPFAGLSGCRSFDRRPRP